MFHACVKKKFDSKHGKSNEIIEGPVHFDAKKNLPNFGIAEILA